MRRAEVRERGAPTQTEGERERGKVENGGARHRLIGGDVPKSPPCHRMREHARRARRLVNVFFLFHSAALLRLVVRDVVDLGIFERPVRRGRALASRFP